MPNIQQSPFGHLYKPIRLTIGCLSAGIGLADMLSAIVPKLNWNILLGTWELDTHHDAQKLTVTVGFFLIMLSYGLIRGKRQAWYASALLLFFSIFLHIFRHGSVLSSTVAGGLLLLMVCFQRCFQARSDPPSVRRGYLALVVGLGIVTLYVIGGFLAFYDQFQDLVDSVGAVEVFIRLTTKPFHLHLSPGTQAFFFGHAIPLLCLSAIIYGIVQLLRPVAAALIPREATRQQLTHLTQLYGTNSISYFALTPDKTCFISQSGRAFISYVLEGRVAVVAGDPIGPSEELPKVIEEFLLFCQKQDWTVVFWQIRQEMVDQYRSFGLHLLKIGEDAILDLHSFTLKGKAISNVRVSARRAEKEGLNVIFFQGMPQNHTYRTQMEQISQHWLAQKSGKEMGFSMGSFSTQSHEEQIYALAVDEQQRVHAFTTFVSIPGRNGWGLDLMRRAEDAAPGTIELMLVRTIEHLRERGYSMLSLGLAPLSNNNETDETFLGTSIDFLTHRFGGQNQSLGSFKKKFHPAWENRYLVFSNTLRLPTIGWALYCAHQEDASLLRTLLNWLKDVATREAETREQVVTLQQVAKES